MQNDTYCYKLFNLKLVESFGKGSITLLFDCISALSLGGNYEGNCFVAPFLNKSTCCKNCHPDDMVGESLFLGVEHY